MFIPTSKKLSILRKNLLCGDNYREGEPFSVEDMEKIATPDSQHLESSTGDIIGYNDLLPEQRVPYGPSGGCVSGFIRVILTALAWVRN